jgi:hypothetical protein
VSELDHALIAGWPLALTVAAFLVRERVRGDRRRGALNRALHELRRPLQALALGADDASRDGGSANGDGPGKLALALGFGLGRLVCGHRERGSRRWTRPVGSGPHLG